MRNYPHRLQTLYESSVAFGMRKALIMEQGRAEMVSRITQLEEHEKDLERQVPGALVRVVAVDQRGDRETGSFLVVWPAQG